MTAGEMPSYYRERSKTADIEHWLRVLRRIQKRLGKAMTTTENDVLRELSTFLAKSQEQEEGDQGDG